MKEKFKYYEIDNRKFMVEKITEDHYELTVFENEEFLGTYNYRGSTAYAEALAEIVSYSEIDERDFET